MESDAKSIHGENLYSRPLNKVISFDVSLLLILVKYKYKYKHKHKYKSITL